jgi:RNA polymerase-binding transcription factor DksA
MQFSDEMDRAAHITDMANEEAVQEQRRKAAPEQVQNEDGSWPTTECLDCDESIEQGRLAMGKVRCFACQCSLEQRRKLYARR